MIRTDIAINFAALDNLEALLETWPELVEDAAERAFARVQPFVLRDLQATPGPVKYPIAWASEKQRKAFFASDGFGHGIPTRRTGAISRGWDVSLVVTSTRITVNTSNRVPYAKYVVGKLRERGRDTQQRMHINTGWQDASETLDFWARAYYEEFEAEYEALLR